MSTTTYAIMDIGQWHGGWEQYLQSLLILLLDNQANTVQNYIHTTKMKDRGIQIRKPIMELGFKPPNKACRRTWWCAPR